MTEQADRFDHGVSTIALLEHAVLHPVAPQLLRPVLAAFMPTDRIVVRSHADKLCCVDTATFIGNAPLTPADTEYLASFPYLVRLSLEARDVDAASLALVAHLTQLQCLNLSDCSGVNAAGLAEVAKLLHLQRLDLAFDADLAEVAKLTHLRHDLGNSCVDAAGIAEVATLMGVNLAGCTGDAAGLPDVAKLMRLQHPELSDNSIDAAGLAEISKLTQLRHLNLRGCHGFDAAGLAEIAKLTQLKHLDLRHCNGVDAAGLAAVAKLPALRQLLH